MLDDSEVNKTDFFFFLIPPFMTEKRMKTFVARGRRLPWDCPEVTAGGRGSHKPLPPEKGGAHDGMRTSRLRQQLPPRCPPVIPWPSRPLGGTPPSLKMTPAVSPTGSDVSAPMVKMAAVYLWPPRNLPLSNMAVAAQLLPLAAARVCPQ